MKQTLSGRNSIVLWLALIITLALFVAVGYYVAVWQPGQEVERAIAACDAAIQTRLWDEALAICRAAVARAPSNVQARQLLADARAGRLDYYYQLGIVRLASGEAEKALLALEVVFTDEPSYKQIAELRQQAISALAPTPMPTVASIATDTPTQMPTATNTATEMATVTRTPLPPTYTPTATRTPTRTPRPASTATETPTPVCVPGRNGIILYEHTYALGGCRSLTSDVADLSQINFNNVASSVEFVGNYVGRYVVTLYDSANYRGDSYSFSQNNSDFNLIDFNDRASSLRIQPVQPTATPTRTPTRTPTPSVPSVIILIDQLNVRSGPGTGYAVLTTANLGQRLQVIGKVDGCAWLQVRLSSGQVGWVSGADQYTELSVACTVIPLQVAPALPDTPAPASLPKDSSEMVFIPAGPIMMGCDVNNPAENGCRETWQADELPLHTAYLDAYYIDKYEVTNVRYKACVDTGGCTPPQSVSSRTRNSYFGNSSYNNYPVVSVTWSQASAFCSWAGKRLPTEAEWEKAARGNNDTRRYPWGNTAPTCESTNFNSGSYASPSYCIGDTNQVGNYRAGASPYGVMDMAGNVWEWANDLYSGDYYSGSSSSNPQGPNTGAYRVIRGGSWNNDNFDLRSANRGNPPPSWDDSIGFRCVRSP